MLILNSLFKRIIVDTTERKKWIALFILLIFLPIILNIYFIHSRTIEVVKQEKIIVLKNVLKKTTETVELKLTGIINSVKEFTDDLAVGASISKYKTVAPNYQDKIDNHITQKLREVVENNFYIDDAFCYINDGRIYSAKGLLKFNQNMLMEGLKHKDSISSEIEEVLFNTYVECEKGVKEKKLILFRDISHIIPYDMRSDSDNELDNENEDNTVGYFFAYINQEKLIDLDSDGSTALVKDNKISIYNQNFTPIIGSSSIDINKDLITSFYKNDTNLKMKEVVIDDKKMVMGVSMIESIKWYLVSLVPLNSLIGSTQNGLRGILLVLGFVSTIVSIVIILQTLAFSKTIVQKEIIDYRLTLSEKVNDKLRIYKHDFMNHLQIIQGLLEMNYQERAVQYLRNVVKEGTNITKEFEIGVPELEVILNMIITEARKENIKVEVETTKLTDELPVTINELIKIVINLTNNAMFALINSEEENKLLKIKINYYLGNYIFEVFNNTPIIPESIRQKIFNKGFSTKGTRGNGLGLYIIKKILSKYEGTVDLIVNEEGNNFIVTIPDSKELYTIEG